MRKTPTRKQRATKSQPQIVGLAAARKFARLTQAELGVRVHQRSHRPSTPISPTAAQNRISAWETGKLRPDDVECEALGLELHRDVEEVKSWFEQAVPYSDHFAIRVVGNLSQDQLMIICAMGPPRGAVIPGLPQTLRDAINKGLSVAVIVPYPDAKLGPVDGLEADARMRSYQVEVLTEAKVYCGEIFSGLSNTESKARLGLFVPRKELNATRQPFPPAKVRFALVLTKIPFAKYRLDRALYVWMTAKGIDDLVLVDTAGQDGQALLWEHFFQEIVDAWNQDDSSIPFFERVNQKTGSYWSSVPIA